jgi:hypothetical protein
VCRSRHVKIEVYRRHTEPVGESQNAAAHTITVDPLRKTSGNGPSLRPPCRVGKTKEVFSRVDQPQPSACSHNLDQLRLPTTLFSLTMQHPEILLRPTHLRIPSRRTVHANAHCRDIGDRQPGEALHTAGSQQQQRF